MWKKFPIAFAMVLVLLVLVVTAFYRRSGSRVDIHQIRHGWVLEYSGTNAASPSGPGDVKKLEFNNKRIAVPEMAPDRLQHVRIFTPVGTFMPDDKGTHWLLIQPGVRVYRTEGEISEEELSRGYYEVKVDEDPTRSAQFPRKKGTPSHWCLMVGEAYARWLTPDKIDKLSWVWNGVSYRVLRACAGVL